MIRALFLLLLLPSLLLASKILNYNVHNYPDRVDVMVTFDKPYYGEIRKQQQRTKMVIILTAATITSKKIENITSPLLFKLMTAPDKKRTKIIVEVGKSVILQAAKSLDKRQLRLRFSKSKQVVPPPVTAQSVKTDTAKKAEIAKKTDTAKKAEIAKKTDTTKKAEVAKKTDTAKKAEIAKKTDTAKKAEITKKTATAKKAEITKKTDTAKKAEVAKKTDTVKKAEVAKKTDTVKKTEIAKKTDTAKKAEIAKKADTAKPDESMDKESSVNYYYIFIVLLILFLAIALWFKRRGAASASGEEGSADNLDHVPMVFQKIVSSDNKLMAVAIGVAAIMLLTPKVNLYYQIEHLIEPYGVILSDEKLDDRGFRLDIKDATLYVKEIESVKMEKTEVLLFLLYNRIDIEKIKLSSTFEQFVPTEVERVNIQYSVLDPLHITIEAVGDFGTAKGEVVLRERLFKMRVEPSKLMKTRYRSTMNKLTKDDTGGYTYESRF
ncbi:MAG: hypothetical protein U9Q62_07380 [Campylobacterota bacterium]|nr:hypothetical protein [Campylobacterota bacterium]